MSAEIKVTRLFGDPSRKEFCDVSPNAKHSVVMFEEVQGYPTAIKLIDLSDYKGDHQELLDLCAAYRNRVRDIYRDSPEIFSAFVVNDNILEIVENAVCGETMEILAKQGDNPHRWLENARRFFVPLKGHIGKRSESFGPYTSNFPLDTLIDAKPANIVVTQSRYSADFVAVPVDFYPPLMRTWSNNTFVHTESAPEDQRVQYSYGDLEVLMAKFFYETKKINPDFAISVSDGYTSLCAELDTTGQLSEGIVRNVMQSDLNCPNCPYCNVHNPQK